MKIYVPRAFITTMIMIIMVLFLSSNSLAADASLKDDAYHYQKNGIDDQLYNEWWYFNAVSNNSQLFVVYLLSDPDNLTLARKIQVLAAVMEDGKSAVIGQHQSRGFGGDLNSPVFDIDRSGFSPDDDGNLKVYGEVNDIVTGMPISWDLNYKPAVSPWFAIPVQAQVGHIKGNWMKWLAFMPSAIVTGTVTMGNATMNINGAGYHDHAWGRWPLNEPQFAWAQVSVPRDGFSLTWGDISEDPQGKFLGIKYGGETISFSANQIKINYTDFEFDNATARIYPSGYRLLAKSKDYDLELAIKMQKNVPVIVEYPLPQPSYLVFWQVSEVQGTLKPKSGKEYTFLEKGFSANTTQWQRHI